MAFANVKLWHKNDHILNSFTLKFPIPRGAVQTLKTPY